MARKIHKHKWYESNIFGFKIWDGLFYGLIYVVMTPMLTALTLSTVSSDFLQGQGNSYIDFILCCLSIIISGFSIVYDCVTRWKQKPSRLCKIKLSLIGIPVLIVVGFCVIEIVIALVAQTVLAWITWIFLIYSVSIVVALFDIIGCITKYVSCFPIID